MTAYNQAQAQLEYIQELLAALQLDFDRYHEAKEELEYIEQDIETARDSIASADTEEEIRDLEEELNELVSQAEELRAEIAEFDRLRLDCEDSDEVMELVMENPLSIEVRSDWVSTSDFSEAKPGEFCIYLCTGGPAVRIIGDLDEHGEPCRAWLEYSDWSTPWTVFDMSGSDVDVLEFAQLFTYDY